MITKEKFIELAEKCFVSKEQYMKMVDIALDSGLIDLSKLEDNFSAVYPLATAIYEKETKWFIDGASDCAWRRKARLKATELVKMFYRPNRYIHCFYEKYGMFY